MHGNVFQWKEPICFDKNVYYIPSPLQGSQRRNPRVHWNAFKLALWIRCSEQKQKQNRGETGMLHKQLPSLKLKMREKLRWRQR